MPDPEGTPMSWGANDYGGAGVGFSSPLDVNTPTALALAAGRTVRHMARQGAARLMVLDDDLVYACGYNGYGELGQGSTDADNHPTPIVVLGVGGTGTLSATRVAVAQNTMLALLAAGTVVGWGRNNFGAVGDGSTTQRTSPVATSTLTGIEQIAAMGRSGYALNGSGAVYAWGDNTYGQLALGHLTAGPYTTPQATLWTSGVSAISATQNGIAALMDDGTVEYAGRDMTGGSGDSGTPAALTDFADVVVLSTGTNMVYGLLADGSGVGTGGNADGEITGDATDPNYVEAAALPVADLVDVSGGTLFTIAIDADGSIWSWGRSLNGELGRGEAFNSVLAPGIVGKGGGNTVATGPSNGFAYLLRGGPMQVAVVVG